MAIYNIPEYRIAELERKLATISKKCAKYGNEFYYKKGNPFFDTVTIDGNKVTIKFFPIEVFGTAKIDKWEFIATLECHASGNVIRRYNTDIIIPDRFRTSENVCEHCGSLRYRKNLYLIHNVETDEFKQVGKNCLQSYTNGLNAEYISLYCSAISLLDEPLYYDDGFKDVTTFTQYYDILEILSVSMDVINQLGYRKADTENSTKDIIKYFECYGKDNTENTYSIIINDIERNRDTVNDIIMHYLNMDNNTEFVHNIKVILAEKYCKSSDIGLLAYLPHGYKKDMEKIKPECNNSFFGEIGKRYKEISVNVSVLTSYNTEYGMTYIYQLIDNENHIFIWKTSNCFESGRYTATMTVKKHNVYNGQNQTEVTRCKLVM